MCITGSEIMLSEIAQHEDLGTTLDKDRENAYTGTFQYCNFSCS